MKKPKPNSFKYTLLSIFSGVAGLCIVVGIVFYVFHSRQTVHTPVTASSDAIHSTMENAAEDPRQSDANTTSFPSNDGTSTNTVHDTEHSASNSTTDQPAVDPGSLGQPSTQPAGPPTPPHSLVGRVVVSAKSSIEVDETDQIVVHAYDKSGNLMDLTGRNVTYEVFTGINGGASVSKSGLFTANQPSLYTVRTVVDGVLGNDVTINVQPKRHPYKLTMDVSNNLFAGSTMQVVVMVHVVDVHGHDVIGAHVTFSNSNPNLVSIDGVQRVTNENGDATVEATAVARTVDFTQTATITATVDGAKATVPLVVNNRPVQIVREGHAVVWLANRGQFPVKLVDSKGRGVPGVGVTATVTGGAWLGANQPIFLSDAEGLVKIPIIIGNPKIPVEARITVPGTDLTWSGTVDLN